MAVDNDKFTAVENVIFSSKILVKTLFEEAKI